DGGSPNFAIDPNAPPVITPFDLTTLNILPGLQSPGASQLVSERGNQELADVSAEANPAEAAPAGELIAVARSQLASFAVPSDQEMENLAKGFSVSAYYDSLRVTAFSSKFVANNNQSSLVFSFDLMHDSVRADASPGQNLQSPILFASARGLFDSFLEAALPVVPGGANLSAASIVEQSMQQGIPVATIDQGN